MNTQKLRQEIVKHLRASTIFHGVTTVIECGTITLCLHKGSPFFSSYIIEHLDIHFYSEDSGRITVLAGGYGETHENLKDCFSHIIKIIKHDSLRRIADASKLYNGILANEGLER